MPYEIVFVGLASFTKLHPHGRLVLLPDGRNPPPGFEPYHATIIVDEAAVLESYWANAEFGQFPIEEPSSIVISGTDVRRLRPRTTRNSTFDESRFDVSVPQLTHFDPAIEINPDEAATIAQIEVTNGTLRALRSGHSIVARLTVPHDESILIEARGYERKRRIVLRAGTEIVIANLPAGGLYDHAPEIRSGFELYGLLDRSRRFFTGRPEISFNLPSLSSNHVFFSGRGIAGEAPVPVTAYSTDAPREAPRASAPLPPYSGAAPFAIDVVLDHPMSIRRPLKLKKSRRRKVTSDEIPRSFYAYVEAPAHVVAGVETYITAGITKDEPTPSAPMFEVPASVQGAYDLTLSVQATGFALRKDVAVFTLPVTKETPYPTVDIFLTADVIEEETPRNVVIFYSVEGHVIGSVERTITVHLEENDKTKDSDAAVLRRIFAAPTGRMPPDLTVMIRDEHDGKLAWSFITPHDVKVPGTSVRSTIAGVPRIFAATLFNNANGREGMAGLYEFLIGSGLEVNKLIPPAFWPVLVKVAVLAKSETPSLLIISNEPHIPWELATFPDDARLFHPDLAPFLGVQACVGRWLIGKHLPPPLSHTVRHAYVFSGIYGNRPKWNRLVNAEKEAAEISATYGATAVEAKQDEILGIFARRPAADLLHFSMHGKSNDESVEDGLIPVDNTGSVNPQMIAGAIDHAKRTNQASSISPFVFLNACQVGAGSRILGDYGGMAAAFIDGGAAGVVAPLWSVKDENAKMIALDFYRATFGDGISPAEAIRRARASFVKASLPVSATYLAYQFFGHPALQLRKES
jgi:hypothetical protein